MKKEADEEQLIFMLLRGFSDEWTGMCTIQDFKRVFREQCYQILRICLFDEQMSDLNAFMIIIIT